MEAGELSERHLGKRVTLDQTDPDHARCVVTGTLRGIRQGDHQINTPDGKRWERRTTLTLVIDFLRRQEITFAVAPNFELDEPV